MMPTLLKVTVVNISRDFFLNLGHYEMALQSTVFVSLRTELMMDSLAKSVFTGFFEIIFN
jgi:hypothetical protein